MIFRDSSNASHIVKMGCVGFIYATPTGVVVGPCAVFATDMDPLRGLWRVGIRESLIPVLL